MLSIYSIGTNQTLCLKLRIIFAIAGTVVYVTENISTMLVFDGNSLLHRSYHALLSTDLRTNDGRPSWAIKGVWNQLLAAVERIEPQGICVCLLYTSDAADE